MGVVIVKGEGAVLGVSVGHAIVTNRDLVAQLLSVVRGGNVAFPKLLWDFLFLKVYSQD